MKTLSVILLVLGLNTTILADVVPSELEDPYQGLTAGERLIKSMEPQQ